MTLSDTGRSADPTFRRASARRPLQRLTMFQVIPALALILALGLGIARPVKAAELQEALDRALQATLVVYSDDLDETFLGSAFLWDDGTIAVTSQHVLRDRVTVELRGPDGTVISAKVIYRDEGRDLALIAVPGAVFGPGLKPADEMPGLGDTVYALGAPMQEAWSVTSGTVSAVERQVEEAQPVTYIQHDAAVNPGSSGGPLVNAAGELVGMNAQVADGSRLFAGIAFAISGSDLARLVPAALAGELPEVPDLGLRVRPITKKIALALGLDDQVGLLIDQVLANSVAGRAGVEPGDILISFDGTPIGSAGDLAFLIDERSGDHPQIVVLRGGRIIVLTLDLTTGAPVLDTLSGPTGGAVGPVKVSSYTLAGLGIQCDGTQVTGVNPGSPALFSGLIPGDTILMINGVPVDQLDLATATFDKPLVVLIKRRTGQTLHVIIDPWGKEIGPRPVGGGANVLDPSVVLF